MPFNGRKLEPEVRFLTAYDLPLSLRLPDSAPGVGSFQLAVIVAMVAVGMVKPPLNEVIDMIAMGNCFVAAVRTMNMIF
jgi:hypothetical protein